MIYQSISSVNRAVEMPLRNDIQKTSAKLLNKRPTYLRNIPTAAAVPKRNIRKALNSMPIL